MQLPGEDLKKWKQKYLGIFNSGRAVLFITWDAWNYWGRGWIIDNHFNPSKNSIKYEQEEAGHVVKDFSFPFYCNQSLWIWSLKTPGNEMGVWKRRKPDIMLLKSHSSCHRKAGIWTPAINNRWGWSLHTKELWQGATASCWNVPVTAGQELGLCWSEGQGEQDTGKWFPGSHPMSCA